MVTLYPWGWARRATMVVLAGLIAGCCPRPATPAATAFPDASQAPRPVLVLEPSPMLAMARGEREAMEPRPSEAIVDEEDWAQENEEGQDLDEAVDEGDSEVEANEDEPEEVRTVVVRTSRFATPEDLARATLRHAESRRPRELYPTRLLMRRAGLVRACGSSREARRAANELVREVRGEVKQCIIDEQTRRPEVVVEAPESLVLQQSSSGASLAYSLSVHLRPGRASVVSPRDGELSRQAQDCIAEVVDGATGDHELGRMEIPLTVFLQPGYAVGGSALHGSLALEAATLGWLHYERGEPAEALAYFRDAYWLYHLVEFQVLIGMALEDLGRPRAAAKAYAQYVERRPHAPEVPRLRQTIARLRAPDGDPGPTARGG